VRVMYSSPANPGSFPGGLSVLAPGWDPVHIPLSLTTFTPPAVTVVETKLLLDTVVVLTGRQAIVPVQVKWLSGPASNISFEKSPIFRDAMVSMQPVSVHVEPGQTLTVPLVLQAAVDAKTGTF